MYREAKRLDHLLSRSPCNWDAHLAFVVGCVFLVPGIFDAAAVWAVVGAFWGCAFKHEKHAAGLRSTPVTIVSPITGDADGLSALVVVWCVVCDLYSG